MLSQWASSVGVELLDMAEMERWGAEEGVRCAPGPVKGLEGEDELDRNRVVTISYTSGTTGAWIGFVLRDDRGGETIFRMIRIWVPWLTPAVGDPKGVVLTNTNLTTATISNGLGATAELTLGEEWRFLSYLPLSHM